MRQGLLNQLLSYFSRQREQSKGAGGKQTPTTTKPKTVPDFPIVVKQ